MTCPRAHGTAVADQRGGGGGRVLGCVRVWSSGVWLPGIRHPARHLGSGAMRVGAGGHVSGSWGSTVVRVCYDAPGGLAGGAV